MLRFFGLEKKFKLFKPNESNESDTLNNIESNNELIDENNNIKIISDEPDVERTVLDFPQYSKVFSDIIINSPPKFSIGIFGDWGTGKTTLMQMIRSHLKESKHKDKILTVWFDPWKYEKDQFLALIPLLKLIETEIENNKNTNSWNKIKEGVENTLTSFIESSKFNIGLLSLGSAEVDLDRFKKSLTAGGSVDIEGNTRRYYSHPTEHLRNALKNEIRNKTRIVVFIDDLDRCTPEKSMEVLESIKSFFDLEGIVYVIGMNVTSIDNIIKSKYGKESEIQGVEYMDKIVQLPFRIPDWTNQDISTLIDTIAKDLKDSELLKALKQHREIIVNAIKNNPRDTKRFINDLIRTKAVFSTRNSQIAPIDQLIVVQALNFRAEWYKFLELIKPNLERKNILDIVSKKIDEEVREIDETETKKIQTILNEDSSFQDLRLKKFLISGALKILYNIKDMEPLRRITSTITPFQRSLSDATFDYETKYQGSTEHFNVYYESSLNSVGQKISKGILETIEKDYSIITDYFGGITLPLIPFNIIIARLEPREKGTMPAYHYDCTGTDIYVDNGDIKKIELNRILFLTVSQVVEVFSATLDHNWDCITSKGEALSRVIASDLYSTENTGFTTAALWLDSKNRLNFINKNIPAYEDLASIGCSVLFLNYLHSYRKFEWVKIIGAGGSTLAETYTNLTGEKEGFTEFNNILQNLYPIDSPSGLATDNPWLNV
jgi:Cdc6-like AAA superfamily ATPase